MKKATSILKILSCIFVSVYMFLACKSIFDMAWLLCQRFQLEDGGYVLAFDRVTSEAIPYFIFAAILFLLGVATVLSLFRRGWLWSVIAGIEALAMALIDATLDTGISEASMWCSLFQSMAAPTALRIIPTISILCVCLVAAYATLRIVAAKKQQTEAKGNNK